MKNQKDTEPRDPISTMYLFCDIVLFFLILITTVALFIINNANQLKRERIAELSGINKINAITIDGVEAERVPSDFYINYDAIYHTKTKTIVLKTAPKSLEQTYLYWQNQRRESPTK